MPTQPCPDNQVGSDIIAQTLFLGASINGFNTSMGWGGQPAQLTVTLVDDSAARGCIIGAPANSNVVNGTIAAQFPLSAKDDGMLKPAIDTDRFPINHYHACAGNDCYIDERGNSFSSTTMDISKRMVPGKVYYEFFTNGGGSFSPNSQVDLPPSFLSKYWYNPDPGFFGQPNRINPDNTYNNAWQLDNSNLNKGYDIIDTPVLFRIRNFSFGGLVQSWTRQVGSGGNTYSVTINSMQSLLNSCYVIIGGYAGAIYSKLANSTPAPLTAPNNSLFGGPRNYRGKLGVEYYGRLYEGNIPNVFNVYGFLESFGRDSFGGSKSNSNGISANAILDALSVLTSATDVGPLLKTPSSAVPFSDYAKRTAFSPFGRILAKSMQENDTYNPISDQFKRFGVIPPTIVDNEDGTPTKRCQFLLDLNEIPRLPDDFRISGPVISITDLLNAVAEQAGFDYYVDLVPLVSNGKIYNVIKVRTISRLAQPRQNEIETTIKQFQCNQYPLSSLTIGKEKNETSARAMIVGGPVQRLYQAKSYRLAYTQSNYIYSPRDNSFIDYMQLGRISANFNRITTNGVTKQFHYGKIKTPSAIDLHNPELSSIINPGYAGIYKHNDQIKLAANISYPFKDADIDWADKDYLGSSIAGKSTGNYDKGKVIKAENADNATWGTVFEQRFFPLFKDVICPFFGYILENEIDVNIEGGNTDFRRIRPVWFDTWTGQIVVLLRIPELPATSVNLESFYNISGVSYFLISESEIRAAHAGFDEFLVYSLAKTFKTDIVEMLRKAYIAKDKIKYQNEGLAANVAEARAKEKHNWYWRLLAEGYTLGTNMSGAFLQTIEPIPDKADASFSIDESALKDLQILHNFVSDIGKYYGKKYMVTAPYLAGYRDSSFANIALPTEAGTAFVFSGGGELHYSYTPTNDGAWEEYGNIIDNCIAVGSRDWYNISDEMGKIKPVLGYNATDAFDYKRYEICMLSQQQFNKFTAEKLNPYWSFENWDIMKDRRDSACAEGTFTYPVLDYSSLSPSDYILVEVSGSASPISLPAIYNQYGIESPTTFTPFSLSLVGSKAIDPFGRKILRANGTDMPMKKLFVTTQIDEKIVFLDPENLKEPRILIDAPGITLNNSSDEFSKDPNRTIIANIAMEDLNIYLHMTDDGQRDLRWIRQMLSHIFTVTEDPGFVVGNASNPANKSAAYAQLAPKMAHPFFAGIPLKSNIYNYGPWTNYPYIEYLVNPSSVFPSGLSITQSDAIPPVCTYTNVVISPDQAQKAVDNWILSTDVDFIDDYTPWNYGGMAFLDYVAMNDARSRTNYQNIIETAQIDMPGLPLFNLGGRFLYGSSYYASIPSGVVSTGYLYTDVKYNTTNPILSLPNGMPTLFTPLIPTDKTEDIEYQVLVVKSDGNVTGGPIITNIQTTVGQQGITTTYSFRTYTRKLGFFNKENSDRVKKMHLDNLKRNKQLSKMSQQTANNIYNQTRALQQQRLSNAPDTKDYRSKLYGWSPVRVLIGQSYPYLSRLTRDPNPITGIIFSSGGAGRFRDDNPSFSINYGNDPGDNAQRWRDATSYISDPAITIPALSNEIRQRTDVGLYEEKEVRAQIASDYGLQSMMSLDGIFSPVSFYPTLKHSTYNFGYYDRSLCPFCSGTKKIQVSYLRYLNSGYGTSGVYNLHCDKCINPEEKLNIKLKSSITSSASSQSLETLPPYIITSGTDLSALLEYNATAVTSTASTASTAASTTSSQAGVSIAINMVSLQPIVVPYGEFRNPNVQHYEGVHPEGSGVHGDLSINVYSSSKPRTFYDRCRHSIEIVGRGAVNPKNLTLSNSLTKYETDGTITINADYYDKDMRLSNKIKDRNNGEIRSYQNNQRFMGLRGPLVLHGWGYDLEGYPVPNAADEPYEIDQYGRPKRFKVKAKDGFPKPVTFKDLKIGDVYKLSNSVNEYVKDRVLSDSDFLTIEGTRITNTSSVSQVAYEDDLSDPGGFPPDDSVTIQPGDRTTSYQGSIISKTQKYENGKWTAKKKLKQFYLNWAERPDLWPVGPIDFRWDEGRKVWATKADSVSSIYKMVYATLEEDLVKDADNDETYPARAFLDDVQYSTEPLANGLRRLIFIKDRGGYTAPRGAKLLCRYDKDTGYYEPVSKQTFVTPGILGMGNNATIELSYIPGRKKGETVPTMLVNFDNPFDFNVISGNKGLFTFMNGKWTLTATKEI